MKTFLVLLTFIGAFWAWQYLHPVQAPVEVVRAPTPPLRHLAPEGTFFLLQYISIPTKHGLTGWAPGQKVSLDASVKPIEGKVGVTDGVVSAAVDPSLLTNDLDIAATLLAGDVRSQAALQAEIARSRLQRARDDQALLVQTAKDIDAVNAHNVAASRMTMSGGHLNGPATHTVSSSGGAVYYPYYYTDGGGIYSVPAAAPAPVDLSHRANNGR